MCGALPSSEAAPSDPCVVCLSEAQVVADMGRHLWRRMILIPGLCLLATVGLCLPMLAWVPALGLGYVAWGWSRTLLSVTRQMLGQEETYGGGPALRRGLMVAGYVGSLWSALLISSGAFLLALQLLEWCRSLMDSVLEAPAA